MPRGAVHLAQRHHQTLVGAQAQRTASGTAIMVRSGCTIFQMWVWSAGPPPKSETRQSQSMIATNACRP